MAKFYKSMMQYMKDRINQPTSKKMIVLIATLVTLMTIYVLILPAFSLDNTATDEVGLTIEETSNLQDNNDTNPADNGSTNQETSQGSQAISETQATTESTSAQESSEEAETYLAGILQYATDNYVITVEVNKDAKLPEDTSLKVTEINQADNTFEGYKDKAMEVVQKTEDEVKSVDLLDISLYSNGELIQPQAAVKVEINHRSANEIKQDEVEIVHFKGDGNIEVLKSKEDPETQNSDSDLSFVTNSFSIYAIVKDGEKVYRHTYIFENADGTPYTFKLNSGSDTDRQIVKDGESLHGVGTPTIASGQHLNGWFEYNKDTQTFGKEIVIEKPISVTEDKTIYVRPNYETVTYVTFYDDADGTQILEKKTVSLKNGKGQINLSEATATTTSATQTFAGWSLTKGGGIITDNVQNYPITQETAFYPIFKEAKKIQFNTGSVGQGATYIAPKMVIEGETAESVKPQDPTRIGYTFGGWYTQADGAGDVFDFSKPVTSDITIYAKWLPAKANYTIVYWQQAKTDAKNAADSAKTYEYAGQTSREGNVGVTVTLQTSDKTAATGFEYTTKKGETQVVVKADGSSVMNVYFNRKLITMRFYKAALTSPPSYSSSYWTNTTYVDTYTGLYGTSLEDNGYTWPDANGSKWNYFTTNSTQGMTYLGEFILPDNTRDTKKVEIRLYKSGTAQVKYYFYKQNTDGSYSEEPTDKGYGSKGTFTFSEKYRGFRVSEYRRYDSTYYEQWYDSDWASAAVDASVYTYYANGWNEYPLDIHIRFERETYNINFLDPLNDQVIGSMETASVVYEGDISDYKPNAEVTVPVPSLPGYVWDGKWYQDKNLTKEFVWEGKMPDHDIKVYAGFRKAVYKITIDPNGGELVDKQSTYFNVGYGEKIVEYKDITRDYVEDESGTFYYRHDTRESDPNQERKAFYTEDASQPNIDTATKYRPEKDGYKLVGWYYVNPDGSTRPYNFNGVVVGDTTLRAIWRRVGDYKVKYSQTVYDYNAVTSNATDKELKDDAGNQINTIDTQTDANTYDDRSHAILLTRTHVANANKYRFRGWYYNGKIYNPYDEIVIDSKLANENKEIVVYPVFKPIDDLLVEATKLIYDGNGGTRQENGQTVNKVEITKTDQNEDILVNQTMLTKDSEYFTRTGYDLIGWNDNQEEAAKGTAKFTFNQEVGIDNLEDKANTLYAVWKPKTYTVTITKRVVGNEADTSRTFTFVPGGSLSTKNFALKDGETKTFEDIPYDSKIMIDEQGYDEFDVTEEITQKNRPSGEADITYEATGKTKKELKIDGDVDVVFTNTRNKQDLSIQKVDVADMTTALQGATFTLYPLAEDGSRLENEAVTDIISNETGYLNISRLKVGTYELVETKAPDGYQLEQAPIKIAVTSQGVSVIQSNNSREVVGKRENDEADGRFYYVTKVTNSKGTELPSTGGVGDYIYLASGLALVLPASLLLYIKRKIKI